MTYKPESCRPEGFWSPKGKPTKPETKCFAPIRFCQVLKGAIGAGVCQHGQNEAGVKFQMEIDHLISVSEILESMSI